MMRYITSGISLKINQHLCVGCGLCEVVCPHQILEVIEKKVRIIEKDLCMECGACQSNCPVGAITVTAGTGCATAVLNSKK